MKSPEFESYMIIATRTIFIEFGPDRNYIELEIVNPSLSFFKIVEKESPPTMRARICCKHLKEYKILDVSVQGIRRCESEKRKENYQEPTICRIYSNKN